MAIGVFRPWIPEQLSGGSSLAIRALASHCAFRRLSLIVSLLPTETWVDACPGGMTGRWWSRFCPALDRSAVGVTLP
jgi:hypothetical protein